MGCARRSAGAGLLIVACLADVLSPASAQMPGQGGMGRQQMTQPGGDIETAPPIDKPDAAASKAFKAAMKSLTKAREFESAAASAATPDKKSKALEKMGDAYSRALDQFTEALSNKGDMIEAWNNVGFIHLRLGAYAEAVDDYNHTLALKPDLPEAVLHRGEAYLATDRLVDAESAYMDLYNHERPLADQFMLSMQQWLTQHRSDPKGMRPADIKAFDGWVEAHDAEAKATGSTSP